MHQFQAERVGLQACLLSREREPEGLWHPITNRLFFSVVLSIKLIRGAKKGTRVRSRGVMTALGPFRQIIAKNA